MVTQLIHVVPAASFLRAAIEGWAHVCRNKAQNIVQHHFCFYHLVFALLRVELFGQIHVAPSMSRNLVAFIVHPSNKSWKPLAVVFDEVSVQIDSPDEESCLNVVGLQDIQQLRGVYPRTVIIRERQCALHGTALEKLSVGNIPEFWPRSG